MNKNKNKNKNNKNNNKNNNNNNKPQIITRSVGCWLQTKIKVRNKSGILRTKFC